jgi:hypothetical protein
VNNADISSLTLMLCSTVCPPEKAAKCDWFMVEWALFLSVDFDVVLDGVGISGQAFGLPG